MIDHEFPEDTQIEDAYRAAYRSLGDLFPEDRGGYIADENLILSEVISYLRHVVDEAEMTVAARLGPLAGWSGPHREGDWGLVMAGVDCDAAEQDFGTPVLNESIYEGPDGRWRGSVMDCAARAYKREARWDFAPGEAGIWLLMLAPVSATGSGEDDGSWFYRGHLVGFVILYDHDKDGTYEAVGHVWTAAAWRRRGIARQLLAEARSRFAFTRVLGPYTEDGASFLRAVGELDTAVGPRDRRAER